MCSIDWAALGSMLGGLAASALAVMAWLARDIWLRQAKFQRKQEVAEDLTVYGRKALSAIELMFYPFAPKGAKARMVRLENESDSDWQSRVNWLWREQVYNEHLEAFSRLEVAALRAGVFLTASLEERANTLLEGARSIVAAAHEMKAFRRNLSVASTDAAKAALGEKNREIEMRI